MSSKSACDSVPNVRTTQRQRSLREMVLTKETSTRTTKAERMGPPERAVKTSKTKSEASVSASVPEVPERRKRKSPSPPTATEVQVDSQSEATSSVREQESATASVVAKVINWEQCNLSPPREILSDNESEASSFDLAVSNVSSKGRPSMLFAPSGKRKGVEMDVATKLANEMLQKGKEALEQACKIKREHKTTALESLAGLYEIVLSLSDSRSRHRCNLEKERSRHATELMRVGNSKQLAGELGLARKDLAANLAETKAIRDWQGYETQEPHRLIKETAEAIADLKQRLKMLNDAVATVRKVTEHLVK
ncbi:hypothetical protein JYU34_020557 [Plutella xylostella]|uniref:Uncharacterized protein n=1 Tax=Plutella xylostella TaxID=51655 RepID=A0ABQ7PUQ5_PLUXY|nr:hypothetical protein JYU34_020557 [Plutella xylostella]